MYEHIQPLLYVGIIAGFADGEYFLGMISDSIAGGPVLDSSSKVVAVAKRSQAVISQDLEEDLLRLQAIADTVQSNLCTERVNVMSVTQRLLDAAKVVFKQGIVKGVPGVILVNFVTAALGQLCHLACLFCYTPWHQLSSCCCNN